MEAATPFLIVIGVIFGAVIGLKVFFTPWRLVEKRLNPEKADKPDNTPEVAFRGPQRKAMDVRMKRAMCRGTISSSRRLSLETEGLPRAASFTLNLRARREKECSFSARTS